MRHGDIDAEARRAVFRLVIEGAQDGAEVAARLGSVDPDQLRLALLEGLDAMDGDDESLWGPLCAALVRFGDGLDDELASRFRDDDRSLVHRIMCFKVWTSRGNLEGLNRDLDDPDGFIDELLACTAFFVEAPSLPALARHVALLVNSCEVQAKRQRVLASVEACRRRFEIDPSSLYAPVLAGGATADVRALALPLLVDEASPAAVALLRTLRDRTDRKSVKKEYKQALTRIRKSAKEGGTEADEVQRWGVWVTSADGVGAFSVVVTRPQPGRGCEIATAVLHLSGEVRDGFSASGVPSYRMDELLERIGQGGEVGVTAAPAVQIAELVGTVVARAEAAGRSVPDGSRRAVELFAQIRSLASSAEGATTEAPPSLESLADGADCLTDADERELTAVFAENCSHDWFFDLAELAAVGVATTGSGKASSAWLAKAVAALDRPRNVHTVVELAEHQARYYAWSGRPVAARALARAALATRNDFRHSPLVRLMLERSAGRVSPGFDRLHVHLDEFLANGDVRSEIGTVDAPTGADMARLHLAVGARLLMDEAVLRLMPEQRPVYKLRTSTAVAMASSLVDLRLGRSCGATFAQVTGDSRRRLMDIIPQPDDACETVDGLRPAQDAAAIVAEDVVAGMVAYFDEVCRICPHDCLDRPDASAASFYFDRTHPLAAAGIEVPDRGEGPRFDTSPGAVFQDTTDLPPAKDPLMTPERVALVAVSTKLEAFAFERAVWVDKAKEALALEGAVSHPGSDGMIEDYARLCHRDRQGMRLVDLFLRDRAATFTPAERAALEALRNARFSLYEVQNIVEDEGVDVRDLARGERFFVTDATLAQQLAVYAILMAWVVDVGGCRYMTGCPVQVPHGHRDVVLEALVDGAAKRAEEPYVDRWLRGVKPAIKALRRSTKAFFERPPVIEGPAGD